MARPVKQGLDYFPMDTVLDDDTQLLIAEIGAEGFGILIILLQIIYANNGYYAIYDKRLPLKVRQKCLSSVETIISVIQNSINSDFFDKEMFETHNILTSRGIQKRYFSAAKKKKKIEINPDFLLIDVSDYGNIVYCDGNPSYSSGNATKESKVKEIKIKSKVKENESKEEDVCSDNIDLRDNNAIRVAKGCTAQSCKTSSEPAGGKSPPVVVIPLNGKTREFPVTQNMVDVWQEDFPAVDVLSELRKMHAWSDANPGKRKTINGVKRFIVNWLSREQDSSGSHKANIGGGAANNGYSRQSKNIRLANNQEAVRGFLEDLDSEKRKEAVQ